MNPPTTTSSPRRLNMWRTAARMFASHPVLGIGPDNFRLEYGDVAGLPNADQRTHTNSMYIEMFVGGGLVGGIAFLWLMWKAADLSGRALRRHADPRVMLAFGVAAAVSAVLVHGVVDSFFSFTPTYVVIAFTLGLAARGESLAAFDERCIPTGCVAPRSNTPGILGRRALPAGRLARLGATPDFHHGLLSVAATGTCAIGVGTHADCV